MAGRFTPEIERAIRESQRVTGASRSLVITICVADFFGIERF